MARLTLSLLSLDPHQSHNKTGAEVFSVLLPQLAATVPHVNAAAGALGAAFDKCVLHRAHYQDSNLLTRLYLNALRQLQDELRRPNPEILPLLIAAMLLAAAESIQHRQEDALSHLLGALSMTKIPRTVPPKPAYAMIPQGSLDHNAIFGGLTPVQNIFQIVDYHVSMFAWGRRPWFPPLPVTDQILFPASLEDLLIGHSALEQRCMHFIAEALRPEWPERIDFPPALVAQQDYLIAWLKRWLRTYGLIFADPSSRPSLIENSHFRSLKAQALTMLIATSNIKPLTQVTYDAYAPQFEEIIRCAEYVLSPTAPTNSSPCQPSLPRYSPFPGIIHPLYFTAFKYRHPGSRRRAIQLLRIAGIEGPFHGELEARAAARIVEMEEQREPFKFVLPQAEMLPPSDILDRYRVYGSWVIETTSQKCINGQKGEMSRRVMRFSKRQRPEQLSRSTTMVAPGLEADGVSRPTGFKNTPDRKQSSHEGEDISERWKIWEEVVEGAWPQDTATCY